ncbi:hypothetical protein TeGR_g12197 [Tetraparma gracilis]|uniref:AB hydrolase-1 domain-containing protein n=1 Tax=Tetraparma gracilis TaxID=2962635 RepID=A0ABQ6MWE2_9STRA|nr:hypothetical protein TeGR_g12197 [Tetraparma gracilis]
MWKAVVYRGFLLLLLLLLPLASPLQLSYSPTPHNTYSLSYSRIPSPSTPPTARPLLLLNGFGVGSFHQERLSSSLLSLFDRCPFSEIFLLDYVGQGGSWPASEGDYAGTTLSAEFWAAQVAHFLEAVVRRPCVLAGNSIGGHLAAIVAAERPGLVSDVVLFNATPVWRGAFRGLGWGAALPAPPIPRFLGKVLYDLIRSPSVIARFLDECYCDPAAHLSDSLGEKIRAVTVENRGGPAAFSSILFSPPHPTPFNAHLSRLSAASVLGIYGAEDPWVDERFARRAFAVLALNPKVGRRSLVMLDGAGHCPNHEAPGAVAEVLARNFAGGAQEERAVEEGWGGRVRVRVGGGEGDSYKQPVKDEWFVQLVERVGR